MTAEWKAYKGCRVAKLFPGWGDAPFHGKVEKVDPKEKKIPFYIRYEDGDSEWISFQELKNIVIDAPATEGPSAPAAAAGGEASGQPADSSKKRSKGKKSGETAPAAAPPPGKKQKASSSAGAAAADGAGTSAEATATKEFDAEKAKRGLKTQADATQGMTQFTFTAGAAQRTAAAGGGSKASGAVAETAADSGGAAVGSGKATPARASREGARKPAAAAAPSSPAPQLPELLTEINQTANTTAQQLSQYRQTARLPYKGSGATMLPAMSQAVIIGDQVDVCLYSTRRGGSQTPSRGVFDSPPEYLAEAEGLLADLDKVLKHARSNKTMLIKVTVTLRNMTDGLPDFKAAWDAWVDRQALPVLTLREGAGPFNSSNITLEATALSEDAAVEQGMA